MAQGNDVMEKIKVVLVTGFLGAGKTTLLNRMLNYLGPGKMDTALLINDFGKINIDAELVDERYYKNIYEVSQGSIFCVCTRDKFFAALDKIIGNEPPFVLLVIEATGIANTGDLNEYLKESDYFPKMEIIENICLVDALNFHKVFATLPAVKNQVQEATVCVINKTDKAEAAGIDINELEKTLKSLNKSAKIVRAEYGDIDFDDIFKKSSFKKWVSKSGLKKEKPRDVYTVSLESNGLIKTADIIKFIGEIESHLMRIKGFFENMEGSFFVEYIGDELTIKPFHKNIGRKNKLVLIGAMMDGDLLKEKFENITSADI